MKLISWKLKIGFEDFEGLLPLFPRDGAHKASRSLNVEAGGVDCGRCSDCSLASESVSN